MRFAWNPNKAAANAAKHGLTFELAITAFDDPFALVALDVAHSIPTEERWWLIGGADTGVVVVVFTVRQPGEVRRIISVRPANRKERRRYDESKGIPF